MIVHLRRSQPQQVPIYWSMIDVVDLSTLGKKPIWFPQYLPHELFHAAWCAGDEAFAGYFLGPDGPQAVEYFWNCVQHAAWYREHPVASEPALLPWMVPVRTHGDDGEYNMVDHDAAIICSVHGCSYTIRDAFFSILLIFQRLLIVLIL